MRGHRYPNISGCYGYGNVAINNITNNITNTNTYVTQVVAHGGSREGNRPHKRHDHPRDRPNERKPELLRYVGSLGLLDGDKASRMNDTQLLEGVLDVGGYAVRGMGASLRDMKRGAGRLAEATCGFAHGIGRIGQGVAKLVGCMFG